MKIGTCDVIGCTFGWDQMIVHLLKIFYNNSYFVCTEKIIYVFTMNFYFYFAVPTKFRIY